LAPDKYFFSTKERLKMVKTGRISIAGYAISTGVLIASLFILLGMGDLGSQAPVGKIPEPQKNFAVQVVDRLDVQTSLTHFSQEGKVFLEGKRGRANVTIPFEKISQIQFSNLKEVGISVKVILRNRETIELQMNKQGKFYGMAQFGTFEIEAKDLKSIRFQP
jgi:hypothetical protein